MEGHRGNVQVMENKSEMKKVKEKTKKKRTNEDDEEVQDEVRRALTVGN